MALCDSGGEFSLTDSSFYLPPQTRLDLVLDQSCRTVLAEIWAVCFCTSQQAPKVLFSGLYSFVMPASLEPSAVMSSLGDCHRSAQDRSSKAWHQLTWSALSLLAGPSVWCHNCPLWMSYPVLQWLEASSVMVTVVVSDIWQSPASGGA